MKLKIIYITKIMKEVISLTITDGQCTREVKTDAIVQAIKNNKISIDGITVGKNSDRLHIDYKYYGISSKDEGILKVIHRKQSYSEFRKNNKGTYTSKGEEIHKCEERIRKLESIQNKDNKTKDELIKLKRRINELSDVKNLEPTYLSNHIDFKSPGPIKAQRI